MRLSPVRIAALAVLLLASGCTPTAEEGCLEGSTECEGACVQLATDNANCGACGVSCTGAQSCREGACVTVGQVGPLCAAPSIVCGTGCVDPRTDNANCGACGSACPAGQVCSAGACAPTCGAGFVTCTQPSGASCASLDDDPSNCGDCHEACPARPHAATVCTAGDCAFVCADGYADCNLDPADGCEALLAEDASHCGTCGNLCPSDVDDNRIGICVAGSCQEACPAGFADCEEPDDRLTCYTEVATSIYDCGACGLQCPSDQAEENEYVTCTDGVCGYSCDSRYGDCDGDRSNGCERSILDDVEHCGACNHACPAPAANEVAVCELGTCGTQCSDGYLECSDQVAGCEVNGDEDEANCGACGNACVNGPNSIAVTCATGSCALTCTVGYGNCDGLDETGCERNVLSDRNHCGACGNACQVNESCVSGTCATPPAGTLDQSYPNQGATAGNASYSQTVWQSYTAARNGELGRVDYFGGFGGAASFQVDVRAGEGSGGTLLASLQTTSGSGMVSVYVPLDVHITQAIGTKYTLVLNRVSGSVHSKSGNGYANGCMGFSGTGCIGGDYDASFQTWVR